MKVVGLLLLVIPAVTAAADTISPDAGWVGTTLLGGVLSWVFFKLIPDKDRMLENKDTYIKGLIRDHATDRETDRKTYESSLEKVTAHCKEELDTLVRTMQQSLTLLYKESKSIQHGINRPPGSKP